MAKPIPEGFVALTPHIIVKDAAKAVEWYKKAFGAKASVCMKGDDGKIMHAELEAFGGRFMIADAMPEYKCFGPEHYKGSPVTMHYYVEDCDAVFKQVVDAGAKGVEQPQDMFWGDRFGKVLDPFGHEWAFATHKVDMTNEEIQKAGDKWMKEMKAQTEKVPSAA